MVALLHRYVIERPLVIAAGVRREDVVTGRNVFGYFFQQALVVLRQIVRDFLDRNILVRMFSEDAAMHVITEANSHYGRDLRRDPAHITLLRFCGESEVSEIVSHRAHENGDAERCSCNGQLTKPAVSKAVLLRRFRTDTREYLRVKVRRWRTRCC